jgi:hypothetical protein
VEGGERLGFKGGLALETSMGTGNFLGLIPERIAGQTRFVGVELDSITARIAKALYPRCPRCGNRRMVVMFEPPTSAARAC